MHEEGTRCWKHLEGLNIFSQGKLKNPLTDSLKTAPTPSGHYLVISFVPSTWQVELCYKVDQKQTKDLRFSELSSEVKFVAPIRLCSPLRRVDVCAIVIMTVIILMDIPLIFI